LVDILDLLVTIFNEYFSRNLAGSLIKTTDLWYETFPGLRPAAVRAPAGYARTAEGPGTIPDIGINDYRFLLKSGISLQGSIPRLKPFQRYRARGRRVAGHSPQECP